ncbi:MAG: protein translocase subunit SecD [Kiloniellales bacterium]|nr:protein translocase subunit SecD [Kiloniellales bacterium]
MVNIPRWQVIFVLGVVLIGLIFANPNLFSEEAVEAWPDWVPRKQINLGLDLQGGSYLLMEADLDKVVLQRYKTESRALRREFREARIGYQGGMRVTGEGITMKLRDPAQLSAAREIIRDLSAEYETTTSDEGEIRIAFTDQALLQFKNNIMEQARQVLEIRINETGLSEPSIQRQGERRVLIQAPGAEDPEELKEIIGQTARLDFRSVRLDVLPGRDPIPPGAEVLPERVETDQEGNPIREPQLFVVDEAVVISGKNLVDAQPSFDQNTSQPIVTFRFDSLGGQRFGQYTAENVGRPFAIVLDDKVISAPRINEPILGGSGQISGQFTVQETNRLALLLRAGALPADMTILEERTVGPGLGRDSIEAGAIASVLGLVFVILFMAISYGRFGLIADIALVANLVLIVAALSGLQATLTLPGIAGIVLTIGMAVDANVLIFERIREEMSLGRGPVTAIDAGYRRAITTILDSNFTTLIAAVLLFYFGSGPVKGFAVTLSIGIITSMFSAIMVTRLILVAWLRKTRPQALPI